MKEEKKVTLNISKIKKKRNCLQKRTKVISINYLTRYISFLKTIIIDIV